MSQSLHESNRARHWVCALQIAERRHQLGLTQQDVVDRLAALGVSTTNRTLSAMEHGQGIDVGRVPELAVALDCSVTYLLGLTSHPAQWVPDDGSRPGVSGVPRAGGDAAGGWYHGVWRSDADPEDGDRPALTQLTANQRASLRRFTDRGATAEESRARPRTRHA
ncbi:MAG TPA: helix-turn-helix transcriptional regulator [Sporichthyaceae bacterium]|jgi:hypothetical protein|nr:helix-turn-helix transcriptional regulator [Sporichthyaceae bacterium]